MSGRPRPVVVPNVVSPWTPESKYWRSLPRVATRLLLIKSHWPLTKTAGLITEMTAAGAALVAEPPLLLTTTSYGPASEGRTGENARTCEVRPGRFVP